MSNVITALTSNAMIAPSFWVDPRSGNDYLLTVQYPEDAVKALDDLRAIPIRAANHPEPTARLDAVAQISTVQAPTEIDHYQLRRVIDLYVAPAHEDIGELTAVDRENRRSRPSCPKASASACAAPCRACALPSPASAWA